MAKLRLRLNNPWTFGSITTFDDGSESLDRPRLKHVPSVKDKYHLVTDFDDLQSLAFKYYGDSKFYFIIKDVNNLDNFFVLNVGKSLIIPDIDRIRATVL